MTNIQLLENLEDMTPSMRWIIVMQKSVVKLITPMEKINFVIVTVLLTIIMKRTITMIMVLISMQGWGLESVMNLVVIMIFHAISLTKAGRIVVKEIMTMIVTIMSLIVRRAGERAAGEDVNQEIVDGKKEA